MYSKRAAATAMARGRLVNFWLILELHRVPRLRERPDRLKAELQTRLNCNLISYWF
jgi:hypothetical protein